VGLELSKYGTEVGTGRVPTLAEHIHQALGSLVDKAREFFEADRGVDLVAKLLAPDGGIFLVAAEHEFNAGFQHFTAEGRVSFGTRHDRFSKVSC